MSPPHKRFLSQVSGKAAAIDTAHIEWSEDRRTLRLTGSWTTAALADLGQSPGGQGQAAESITVDGTGLTGLDTAGALLIYRLLAALKGECREVRLVGIDDRRAALLDLVTERVSAPSVGLAGPPAGEPSRLERLGRLAVDGAREGFAMLSFGGEASLSFLRGLPHPGRFRWRQALLVVELDGVRAMPVLGMLSFLLGVVIAYQAGVQLRLYGGNLYVVDLVCITVLRELGPLMTAIVVAGRSGSAYTAQIGTMQVTEEIDALRSIGVAPQDLLVLPKIFGLVIALPLLTVFADLAAVAGGLVMSALMLDLSPETFLRRIPEAVSINSLMTGLAKAPVFAAVIAAVGCYQGFQVRGGADSVGRNTTTSVVQAIVLVIVIDAGFSVIYSWLEI
jgi:phospholipid/cholesterol/gamma-HCH transport system permease protein